MIQIDVRGSLAARCAARRRHRFEQRGGLVCWSDYDGDDDADYADDDSSYTTWCDELADADEERSSTPTDQSTTQSAALTTRLVLSLTSREARQPPFCVTARCKDWIPVFVTGSSVSTACPALSRVLWRIPRRALLNATPLNMVVL